MKRRHLMLMMVLTVFMFAACDSSKGNDASEVTDVETTTETEYSGETAAETDELVTEAITETSAQSDVITSSNETYSLRTNKSNGWLTWEEDFSKVILTPIYAEYIIQGNENYPAKFMSFDKPADTALYLIKYDRVIYINRSESKSYEYYAYDKASFELFLEDATEEDIIDTGSDKSSMHWNADREKVYTMLDIKDDFGGTAKLVFLISDYAGETSKEDMIELAKSELARIESTMEILEPDRYWSVDKFSGIELYDDYAEVGIAIDVSELIVVSIELKGISLYTDKDGTVYNVKLELGDYVSDGAAESFTPGGNVILLKETEYNAYAYYQLDTASDNDYYLEIRLDVVGDIAYELIDEVISRVIVQ